MRLLLLLGLLGTSYGACCQFRTLTSFPVADSGNEHTLSNKKLLFGNWFRADRQSSYRIAVPRLAFKSNTQVFNGESYWVRSVTTQSYNHGKLGTFYYWDQQGNLRESHFFLDIAGRNKRGLKLVIPRR